MGLELWMEKLVLELLNSMKTINIKKVNRFFLCVKCKYVFSKCKNCTLEELAVLRILQQTPSATQKQIAAAIGKSERTVKTLTVNLTNKGIISRRNGKRNGYWEINE